MYMSDLVGACASRPPFPFLSNVALYLFMNEFSLSDCLCFFLRCISFSEKRVFKEFSFRICNAITFAGAETLAGDLYGRVVDAVVVVQTAQGTVGAVV